MQSPASHRSKLGGDFQQAAKPRWEICGQPFASPVCVIDRVLKCEQDDKKSRPRGLNDLPFLRKLDDPHDLRSFLDAEAGLNV